MIYFLTASKDATVYLQQPNQNTGLDEILEVQKVYYGNIKDVSHALLKFDMGPPIYEGGCTKDRPVITGVGKGNVRVAGNEAILFSAPDTEMILKL
jgi:hypothetical protein